MFYRCPIEGKYNQINFLYINIYDIEWQITKENILYIYIDMYKSIYQLTTELSLLFPEYTMYSIEHWQNSIPIVNDIVQIYQSNPEHYTIIFEESMRQYLEHMLHPITNCSYVGTCSKILNYETSSNISQIECQEMKSKFYFDLGSILYRIILNKNGYNTIMFQIYIQTIHRICKKKFIIHSKKLCDLNDDKDTCSLLQCVKRRILQK